MIALRKHLYERYGSFADRRIKDPSKSNRFIADTRAENGIASDGSLYGWFCGIILLVDNDKQVELVFTGNIPSSVEVDRQFQQLHAESNGKDYNRTVTVSVGEAELPTLLALADAIEGIVKPGRRYDTPNYKYMCPRTAYSIREVARHLTDFWKAL